MFVYPMMICHINTDNASRGLWYSSFHLQYFSIERLLDNPNTTQTTKISSCYSSINQNIGFPFCTMGSWWEPYWRQYLQLLLNKDCYSFPWQEMETSLLIAIPNPQALYISNKPAIHKLLHPWSIHDQWPSSKITDWNWQLNSQKKSCRAFKGMTWNPKSMEKFPFHALVLSFWGMQSLSAMLCTTACTSSLMRCPILGARTSLSAVRESKYSRRFSSSDCTKVMTNQSKAEDTIIKHFDKCRTDFWEISIVH